MKLNRMGWQYNKFRKSSINAASFNLRRVMVQTITNRCIVKIVISREIICILNFRCRWGWGWR